MSLWNGQRARAAALTLALVAAGASWAAAGAPAASAAERPSLSLIDQSQWVTPSADGGAATFELTLQPGGVSPGTSVTVALYPRLRSRTSFEHAVTPGPSGNQLGQTTEPLSDMPADPRSPGSVDMDITVTTSAATTTGPALDLGCSPPTGSGTCPGVYPVVVSLAGASNNAQFTTFLTYAAAKSTTPLDFAWVVPVSAPVTVRPRASDAPKAVAPVPAQLAGGLEELVSQLHASPTVPVTIAASPETLQALGAEGAPGRLAVATLASMSANQAVDEVPPEPYVPVNLGALSAGAAAEVGAQMAQGAAVFQKLRVATTTTPVWVDTRSVGSDLAAGLADTHAGHLVLPEGEVADISNGSDGTWAASFDLALKKGTTPVPAAAADPVLRTELVAGRADPALAATQLLADLAMVHFERPNTATPRGLVAVPPTDWTPDATFDRVLLAGLQDNPDVAPVTLSKFFAAVPAAGVEVLSSSGPGPALATPLSRALGTARAMLSGFDSAVLGDPAILTQLTQLLLDAEDDQLPQSGQQATVDEFRRVLGTQLHLVRFATGTITLTARTGWIPITVVSTAPYTLAGTLSVNGNEKFVFPDRSAQPLTLDHSTNPVRFDVRARSSGDLALTATFTTPRGTLVIAKGTLTVRSTATSLVGIVLTAVALAVLLGWWSRTWWSARRRRRSRALGDARP